MTIYRKYINKQQHKLSCGPVAILNAIKWLRWKGISYREMFPLFYGLGFNHEHGQTNWWFSRALNLLNIKHKFKQNITMTDIENALDAGHAVVVNYAWSLNCRHYFFVTGHTNKKLVTWNSWKKHKDFFRRHFKNSKRRDNGRDYPKMWIIYK